LLTFSACRATAVQYTCTKFGVDSSSRLPFRARTYRQTDRQTNKQTDATERRIHAGGYAGVRIIRMHLQTNEHLTENWQPVWLVSKPIASIHVCRSNVELPLSKLHKIGRSSGWELIR